MPGLWMLKKFVQASDSLAVRLGRKSAQPEHLQLGRKGEEAAYFYLRRHGYTVAARGWRSGKVRGDLDLVAWEGDTLCFVEVKARSSHLVATAEAAVDEEKMGTLRRLAKQYLLSMPDAPGQVRFDILSIYFEAQTTFELFRGAFGWH